MTDAMEHDALYSAEQLLTCLERQLAWSESSLELGLAVHLAGRAAQLLAHDLLEASRDAFPVTIQALMTTPAAGLDLGLDALVDPRELLGLPDLLDMLSDDGLTCIAPRLHRGWLDRKQSCREARRVATERVGFAITGGEREDLLLGLAISNRFFVVPPPLSLEPERARRALLPMLRLVERLARSADAPALLEVLGRMTKENEP